jgi:hypothetical protein
VSNVGGPNSIFEKDWRRRFRPLEARLKRAEDKLVAILSTPSTVKDPRAIRSATFWNSLRKEIDNVYKDMERMVSNWNTRELPLRYRRSLRDLQVRINTTKSITNKAKRTLPEMLLSRQTQQITTALTVDANAAYTSALVKGRSNIERLTRQTQQILLNERLIDATVAEAFNLGNLRDAARSLKSMIDGELLDAAAEKHFVQAGSRKYTPSYYAEMVTRTKFHEAHSLAALAQGQNYGTDLMQVSSHNTTTAICLPFEGKVFSVSGKDSRFPPLTETPPYHPNCLHLLFPAFESGMEVQGTLDAFSAFSRDQISRPPVPAGFIPIAKRKIA